MASTDQERGHPPVTSISLHHHNRDDPVDLALTRSPDGWSWTLTASLGGTRVYVGGIDQTALIGLRSAIAEFLDPADLDAEDLQGTAQPHGADPAVSPGG